MISCAKRRTVKSLLHGGWTQRDVARRLAISVRSVKRIAKEPEPLDDDGAERRRRRVGRPSTTREYAGVVRMLHAADPDTTAREILREMERRGYSGGRSAAYALIKRLRIESASAFGADRESSAAASLPLGSGQAAVAAQSASI